MAGERGILRVLHRPDPFPASAPTLQSGLERSRILPVDPFGRPIVPSVRDGNRPISLPNRRRVSGGFRPSAAQPSRAIKQASPLAAGAADPLSKPEIWWAYILCPASCWHWWVPRHENGGADCLAPFVQSGVDRFFSCASPVSFLLDATIPRGASAPGRDRPAAIEPSASGTANLAGRPRNQPCFDPTSAGPPYGRA